MAASIQRLCVFCGSGIGSDPAFVAAAREVGVVLASQQIALVYGGGGAGLMGAIADATLAAGGAAIGVIPHALATAEIAHSGLTEMHVVDTMHERKSKMADLADGFLALPGGLGTLEEIFEILTWAQLEIHDKPCGFLNAAGYYDRLIEFLDQAVTRGLLKPEYRGMILVATDPAEMLAKMRAYQPPPRMRWITRAET